MWVSVLEKAYAKSYGTYTMLENGYVHHALRTLTGYDSEEIFLLQATQGPARLQLWEKLQRFAKNGFLMGCGTIANNAANAELMDSGLVFGACYAVYQVRSVDGHKLLQLRNPPGDHGEWRGDWGDDSQLWTTRLKSKLGWTDDASDGTFWMSFDDFCLAFRSLYVCHYYDPKIWSFAKMHSSWSLEHRTAAGLPSRHNPRARLNRNPQWVLELQRPTDVHIKASQVDPDGSPSAFPQPMSVLLVRSDARRQRHVARVAKLKRNDVVGWTGAPNRALEKHLYVTLPPGFYVVMVAAYDAAQEGPFELHIDSSFPVDVTQLYPRTPKQPKPDGTGPGDGLGGKPARPVTARTQTMVASALVGVQRPSRRARMKKALERRLAKTQAAVQRSGDRLEVLAEKGLQALERASDKKLGIPLQELLPRLYAGDKESDDDDDNVDDVRNSARSDAKEPDTAAAIEDVLESTKAVVEIKKEKKAVEVQEPQAEAEQAEAKQAINDWVEALDPGSGKTYYYSTAAGTSVWEKPEGFAPGGVSDEMDAATRIQSIFRSRQSRAGGLGE